MRPRGPAEAEGALPRARRGRIACTLAAAAVLGAAWAGFLAPLDRAIADARFSLWQRAPTGRVTIVDIDADSLRDVGRWPWDRRTFGQIVDRLFELGADSVALDVDFSADGRADDDGAFEAALKRAGGFVILPTFKQRGTSGAAGGDAVVMAPRRPFAENSWPSSVNQWPDEQDADGRVRGSKRFERIGDETVPSLATALVGPPPSSDDTFQIDYGIRAWDIPHVSVKALLARDMDPARIAGQKVIVGATAMELGDIVHVPRFTLLPGVALHAMAAESLIQGRALRPVAPWLTLLCCGALLAAALAVARRFRLAGHLAVLAAAGLLGEGLAAAVQAALPLQPATAPLHAGLLCFALIAVAAEIDDRRVRIARSRAEADRLRAILDRVVADNFAGIVVVDHDGAVRAASAAAAAILGLPPGLDGPPHFRAVLPAPLAALCAEALAGGPGSRRPARELRCAVRGGEEAVLEAVATPSRVPGPVGPDGRMGPERRAVCLSFADVTEKRAAEARLIALARSDALTGLSDRRVLIEGIEAALARPADGTATGLLFFDLDRFGVVNDRLGHAAGDALLCAVAERLRACLGAEDLAARLGGDEFAVLARRASPDDVARLGAAVAAAVGGVHAVGPYEAEVGVSLGIALAGGAADARALMREADAALAAARAAGGGAPVLYDAAMARGAADERALEQDLRDGLRRGEFRVHYQRQVDLASGRITGVEALVRWPHPVLGPVSPGRFIPLAERTGLIEELGALVLRTACRDAAAWPVPIKVSVNLSAVQLQRGDLAATVFGALADSGLPAARLDLELTESLLMENDGTARERLDRFRAAGISLSLDDFGTGFSSLSYLRTFSVDKLKIDQSFVRGLPADEPAAAIIAAVVSLAGRLGVRVNAEGCETAEQLEQLRALGCHEVQGWFHGRPEPSEAIARSLREMAGRAAAGAAA